MIPSWRGIFTIPQSVFHDDGRFDDAGLETEVEYCVMAGAHGIVWPVMASEFTVLTEAERRRTTELLLARTAGRIPVVIGVAPVWTESSVALAQHAQDHGADAIISLPPYVQKPTRGQAFTFYRALAEAVDLPLFLQNCGGAMGMAFSGEEIAGMVAENGPLAVEAVLRTLRETSGMTEEEAFAFEAPLIEEIFGSEDAKEGPRAFSEKRIPKYRRC